MPQNTKLYDGNYSRKELKVITKEATSEIECFPTLAEKLIIGCVRSIMAPL